VHLDLIAPAGWISVFLAVETRQTITLEAREGDFQVEVPGGDSEAVAVFYDQPLGAFGVAAGPLPFVEPTAPVRPLPGGALARRARAVSGGVAGAVVDLVATDPRILRIRLASLEGPACAMSGRCLIISGADRSCSNDCAIGELPAPEPPEPPAAPEFGPCATGGTARDGVCVPPALGTRPVCGPGEAQHFGAPACAPIGARCPVGPWPPGAFAASTRFVDPAGLPGPNGEVSYPQLADALVGTSSGAVIVLSKATHAGGVTLNGHRLLGACAARTIIAAPANGVTITGAGRLQDLSVQGGSDAQSITVPPDEKLVLQGVIVERQGVRFTGRLEADDVLFRAIGGLLGPSPARAIWSANGTGVLSRIAVEHRGDESIRVGGPEGHVEIRDLVVTSTTPSIVTADNDAVLVITRALLTGASAHAANDAQLELEDATFAAGTVATDASALAARSGGQIVARRVAIARPTLHALDADRGAIRFEDGWIEDQGTRDTFALAVATAGATLAIARSTLAAFDTHGVLAYGGRAELTDVVFQDARGGPIPLDDFAAITVDIGGQLSAERITIRRVLADGVIIVNAATAMISDLTIDTVTPAIRGHPSEGVFALVGGVLALDRAELREVDGAGVRIEGSAARIEDLRVIGAAHPTDGADDGVNGGVTLRDSRLVGHRIALRGMVGQGLTLELAAHATVRDLDIEATGGHGISIRPGIADLTAVRIRDAGGMGIEVADDSELRGSNIHVRGVTPIDKEKGWGVWLASSGHLSLDHSSVGGADESALRVELRPDLARAPPTAIIEDCVFSRSPVGAQILLAIPADRAGIELLRVRLIENGTDLVTL